MGERCHSVGGGVGWGGSGHRGRGGGQALGAGYGRSSVRGWGEVGGRGTGRAGQGRRRRRGVVRGATVQGVGAGLEDMCPSIESWAEAGAW